MKLKVGIVVLGFVVLGCSVMAETVAEPETFFVDSERALVGCIEVVQRQYFPVSLPSLSARLLQPAGSFPFVHEGFDSEQRATFRGWIDENGSVRYTVGLYEDYWTGEIVVLDDSGWEMFRIPREKTYDPYDLQREFFDLGKKEVLEDEFTREIFLPSKISTIADLVPLVFWDAHVQIEQELATQQALLAAQEAEMAASEESGELSVSMSLVPAQTATELSVESELLGGGMMAMSSSPPPPPGGGGGGSSTNNGSSNLVVELALSLPEGFGEGYIEIFSKDDLILSSDWTLEDDWVPTYGAETVYWTDPASSNKMQRYYYINDGVDQDGDGRSDLYEAWNGTSSNTFNVVDTENGGIGDGMHDWWEEKLFGDLSPSRDKRL